MVRMYLHDEDDKDEGGDSDCIWIKRPFVARNAGADQRRIEVKPRFEKISRRRFHDEEDEDESEDYDCVGSKGRSSR